MQTARLLARTLGSVSSSHRVIQATRSLSTSNSLNMPLKVGDTIPSVDLFEGDPGTKVNTGSFKGKVVIFGVPGAFTPTCSIDHAPKFVTDADAMKAKGVTEVVCIGVNDPFVMQAWAQHLNGVGKVRFLSDPCADFAKKADLDVDLTAILGNVRSKRYVMVVEDLVVKFIKIEPDPTAVSCTRPVDIMKQL